MFLTFKRRMSFYTHLIIFFVFSYYSAESQNYCGTSLESQNYLREAAKNLPFIQKDNLPLKYIPMQVHIVLTDNGGADFSIQKLKESICTLNNDFIPTGFQFYMEKPVRYIKSTKYNEHNYDDGEQMMKENNVADVINVYIVSSPAGNCGYYTYRADAVALSKSCTSKNSHTWAHEFGHYFSLPHTFSGWEGIDYKGGTPAVNYESEVRGRIENIDRSGCESRGDGFCDTPPDYISNRWGCNNSDSSLITLVDLQGKSFKSDGSLFMSYSLDNCSSRFSSEQMSGMQNFLESRRSDLKRNITLKSIAEFDNTSAFPLDSAVTKSKVKFSWKEVENASSYLFQLSRNPVFSVLIHNLEIKSNSFEADSLIQGRRYYWRVLPLSHEDFCNTQSNQFTFLVDNHLAVLNQNTTHLNVYPTLLNQQETVFIRADHELKKHIKMFSSTGHDMNSKIQVLHQANTAEISTGLLNSGIYFLHVDNQIFKIIISR